MDELTKQIYQGLHEKINWESFTHSVMCEMYSAQLNAHIRDYTEKLATDEGRLLPAMYQIRVRAQIEAYILLVVDLTEKAIELFLAEGFTEQEQAEYYPKEMGDWGEGA